VGLAVENDGFDPVQRAIDGALTQRAFASDTFRRRLDRRFGKGAGEGLALMAPRELLDAIDKADVTFPEHFLEATLQVGEKRYRFIRGWRLAASNFTRNGQPDVDDIKRQTKVLNETAEEVRTGKFKTRAEAIDRVRQRLNLPIAA
jgi:hypothetical protein